MRDYKRDVVVLFLYPDPAVRERDRYHRMDFQQDESLWSSETLVVIGGSSLPLGIKRHLPKILQEALRRRLIKTGEDLLQFFVAEVVVHSFTEYLPEIRSHGQVAPFVELL